MIKKHTAIIILFFIALLVCAFVLRFSMVNYAGYDYMHFLSPWYDFIKSHGGFHALKYDFSDYAPMYLYLLTITSALPLSKILAIKIISICADAVLAFVVFKLVSLKYRDWRISALAAMVVLFTPTIVLNGAFWGQSDAIYTAGLLGSLYFILKKKQFWAFLVFGIAFCFKLQVIFLVPFLGILLLSEQIDWQYLLLIPSVYIVSIIPAWIAGRGLADLLTIYLHQSNEYPNTTFNAANIYQWMPTDKMTLPILIHAGEILTVGVVLLLWLVVYMKIRKFTRTEIIRFALLSAIIVPFFLPKMHDRYFYPADVLSIVYAFYEPKYFVIPIVVQLVSFFSYGYILFGAHVLSMQLLAIIMLGVLAEMCYLCIRQLYFRND